MRALGLGGCSRCLLRHQPRAAPRGLLQARTRLPRHRCLRTKCASHLQRQGLIRVGNVVLGTHLRWSESCACLLWCCCLFVCLLVFGLFRFVVVLSTFGRRNSTRNYVRVSRTGLVALINHELMVVGEAPLGFLNPWLYANPQMFTDVTAGSNPYKLCDGFQAAVGWDPVTGSS